MDYLPAKITETSGYYVQCVTAGDGGPLIGTFYPVIMMPSKSGDPYDHNGYMTAAYRTCDKLANQRAGSEWVVCEECTHTGMATARYEMRAAAKRALTGV